MCTAIGLRLGDRFFGRNLDLDHHFEESIVLTPRGYRLPLRHETPINTKYAFLGMAAVVKKFPLYAEAFNEQGVAMAGLNFLGNAVFSKEISVNKRNIATFELTSWVLGQAGSVRAARGLLEQLQLCDTAFSDSMPAAELHWFLTDGEESLVLESTKKGIRIYEDPLCVLTNNPPFLYQLVRAIPFLEINRGSAIEAILQTEGIETASLGHVPISIPGDYSSTSRFVRAAKLVGTAKALGCDLANVATCFQILSAVAPIHGSVQGANRQEHYTLYSVVANLSRGEFYCRRADNPRSVSVRLSELSLDATDLVVIDPGQ